MGLLPGRYSKWAIMGAMLATVLCTGTAVAQGRLFGIVGKSADDANFSEVARILRCRSEQGRGSLHSGCLQGPLTPAAPKRADSTSVGEWEI